MYLYYRSMDIFLELAMIVFIASFVSVIMRLLRQPLIVGYILAGILAGPYFFNAVHTQEFIEILSKMGITILLFIVGLNMTPKVIKEIGKVSLFTGVSQVIITSIVGFLLILLFGFSKIEAAYIAVALTFSS